MAFVPIHAGRIFVASHCGRERPVELLWVRLAVIVQRLISILELLASYHDVRRLRLVVHDIHRSPATLAKSLSYLTEITESCRHIEIIALVSDARQQMRDRGGDFSKQPANAGMCDSSPVVYSTLVGSVDLNLSHVSAGVIASVRS